MKHDLLLFAAALSPLVAGAADRKSEKRPNILFVISDDQSYFDASAYGSTLVRTPSFDRVVSNGVLFTRAYVTSPGSSPSRASILTGRYPWQIEDAGTHSSTFPVKYKTYPLVLEKVGYHVGLTGKGWAPGDFSGWAHNPAGKPYNDITTEPPTRGIGRTDYVANFEMFLSEREEGQPFCFWFGCREPHRPYEQDSYLRYGLNAGNVGVPGFLPDAAVVRGDLLDYAVEIEWFDEQLGRILDRLDEMGETDNTIVIVTADNGMPFPRAKANCYDHGIHVPLAIAWDGMIEARRVVDEPVSMIDMAPTLLDAAGVAPTGMMPVTGASIMPMLTGEKTFDRNKAVFASRERHSSARKDNVGYPQRVVVCGDLLYVRNFHPERFPAGDPLAYDGEEGDRLVTAYFDVDNGPTKSYILDNRDDPAVAPYFEAAFGIRPFEELYDLHNDPYCSHNLVGMKKYGTMLVEMRRRLDDELVRTGDTRLTGGDELWESYIRYAPLRRYP